MTKTGLLLEFDLFLNTGKYDNLIRKFDSIKDSETFSTFDIRTQIECYHYYFRSNQRMNKIDKLFEIIDEMKIKFDNLKRNNNIYYSGIYVLEGTALSSIKDYFKTEKVVNEGLLFIDGLNEIKNDDFIYVTNMKALLFNLLGIVYATFYGNVPESTKAYETCLALSKQTDFGFGLNLANVNLTTNYSSKGDFSKAEFYTQESINRTKSYYETLGPLKDNKDWIYSQIFNKSNLGIIQFNKGDYLASKETFMGLLKTIEGTIFESRFYIEINLPLLRIYIRENNLDAAIEILDKMEKYRTEDPEDKLLIYYGFVLYYLKMNNLRDKFKAVSYIEKILNYNPGFTSLKNEVKFNLIEINLLELKANFDEKLFKDTMKLLNEIYEYSQANNSYITLVNLLILKSRISRIAGELEEAESFLKEAQAISEKNLTKFYIDKVKMEREDLIEEFRKWDEMIKNNTPLSKRIHQIDMEKYFEEVKSILPLRIKK